MEQKTKKVLVVTPSTHKRIKSYCKKRGIKMYYFVTRAVNKALAEGAK